MKSVAALVVVLAAGTAAAQDFFVPINLTPFANERVQARIPALTGGAVVLGSVPFFIDRSLNNTWSASAASGANPRVLEIPVNLRGVKEVHTLINTNWGSAGPSLLRVEFIGTNGAFFAKDLVGGVDVRDWIQGAYTNTTTSADTANVFAVGQTRVDKQRIDLPAAFDTEDLLRIRVVDTGDTGVQRALVQGVTVVVDQPDPVIWPCALGGNDHRYQAFQRPAGVTWAQANDVAIALGGHLATLTSAAENAFAYSLVGGNQAFWAAQANNADQLGPWLGGTQAPGSSEPAGGWGWVTGEPFAYSNWAFGEPNNVNGGTEDRLQFFGSGVPAANTWNDYPAAFTARGFIVEFPPCPADFNGDGFVDFFDFDDYVTCFESEVCPPCRSADTNGDGFVDFFDFDDYVTAFETGC